jgi:hypothetical protein
MKTAYRVGVRSAPQADGVGHLPRIGPPHAQSRLKASDWSGILGGKAGCKPTDFRVNFGKFFRLAPAVGGADRRPSMKGPER